ncbi:MAG: gamma carbonic anhydrase family protein [Melioribacteraceae bacterium]|nr:gamma carbonic anhydrase family protein [Melioribacteraceae bacterium]
MKRYQLDNENKLFPYQETFPKLHDSVFLASGSKIIGDVVIGENSSVWYNTIIRGDVHYIKIGRMTNVQDNSMLHVTNGKFPLNIGDKVTIGHSVTLHGCTLNDLCLIGMGAIILDGAWLSQTQWLLPEQLLNPVLLFLRENLLVVFRRELFEI